MQKRAEQINQTRQRILEAAVRLHTTIGPANTTVSALAEEAGVTRLTVYRHFPDGEALFAACQAHWAAKNPPPDPGAWLAIPDLEARAGRALSDLYGWFAAHEGELFPIHRDRESMPESALERLRQGEASRAASLVEGSGLRGRARRRLDAAAGHVTSFWTWRSLVVEQGLGTADAVELAVGLLTSAAAGPR